MDWIAKDTIAAIATATGAGGISIIRLSGVQALNAAKQLFKFKQPPKDIESHRLYYGSFHNPHTEELIDQGLFVFMRAPHSFTGQDSVEFHLHGGHQVPHVALKAVLECPQVRQAEPGEFSFRAYLNQRLSIAEAETIHAIILSQSQLTHKMALKRLQGNWQGKVDEMHRKLVDLLSKLEAELDFPDAVSETFAASRMQCLHEIDSELSIWLAQNQWQPKSSFLVCLAGPANVGKSTLFNALLRQERALVDENPGTTRDYLEAQLDIGGMPVTLMDTAGFRNFPTKDDYNTQSSSSTSHHLELQGIARSADCLKRADLIFWIDDSLSYQQSDSKTALNPNSKTIRVLNKVDLLSVAEIAVFNQQSPAPILISAKNGTAVLEIKQQIEYHCNEIIAQVQNIQFCVNDREMRALKEAQLHIGNAIEIAAPEERSELLAQELWKAAHALEQLSGRNLGPDIVEAIFKNFCIGK